MTSAPERISREEIFPSPGPNFFCRDSGLLIHIFAQSAIGLSFFNRERRCVAANRRISEIVCRPLAEMSEASLEEVFEQLSGKWKEMADFVFSTGKSSSPFSLVGLCRLGENAEFRNWTASFEPLREPNGDFAGATCAISESGENIKRIALLELERKELLEEKELREKLVADQGHDLRSPVTIAKAAAHIIASSVAPCQSSKRFLRMLNSSLDRMDQMIGDMLDASKLERGEKISALSKQSELRACLLATLEDLNLAYPQRLLYPEVANLPEIWGEWSPSSLCRIVENLVHNAVRHGKPGAPVTIEAHVDELGHDAIISVQNFGEPIPDCLKNTLFDRFQRNRESANSYRGWGLGLAIVKTLTEEAGGKVTFESDSERGTCFFVTLPIRPPRKLMH